MATKAKYLNYAGLQKVWNIIKTKMGLVEAKADRAIKLAKAGL